MIEINKLTIDDVERVVELETSYLGETLGKDMLIEEINRGVACFLKATDNDFIIGYIGGYFIMDEGEILNFVVDEAYRRRGIGTKLINALINNYPHTKSIVLEVRKSNIIAQKFYNHLGFHQISTRINYYKNGEDALVLRKEINHDNTCGRN